jgi:hypothetical protein
VARVSVPTERDVQGPLLIDSNQLDALDKIIDHHVGKLAKLKEDQLDEWTEETLQDELKSGVLKEEGIDKRRPKIRDRIRNSLSRRDSRSATIYLARGKEVQADRFSDVMSQPVGQDELPLGFRMSVRVGEVRADVETSRILENLSIDVNPNDVEAAQELFGALSNWASDIEASRWQQNWLKIRFAILLILSVWLFMGLIVVPLALINNAGTDAAKAEAHKLLAAGVNQDNEKRALELILAIQSEYDPGVRAQPLGVRYWSYFCVGALALLVASICPKISIGVWGGKPRLKRWRSWITTVAVTIPVLIAGSFILPWALHFLGLGAPN